MELTIKINLDNDAYKENMTAELTDQLNDLIRKTNWGDESGIIHDSNGNKTGFWSIENE